MLRYASALHKFALASRPGGPEDAQDPTDMSKILKEPVTILG
jgi:hypothetical protein